MKKFNQIQNLLNSKTKKVMMIAFLFAMFTLAIGFKIADANRENSYWTKYNKAMSMTQEYVANQNDFVGIYYDSGR